ncbi:MAG TPA: glucose 1-dehydrogenase [Puia sp.]|nr:glucose 1-dehydrogenase [Puia sp.]
MNRLTGKVALVTGASKGIGTGIAKGLAAEGASVIVNYVSNKTDADRVVSAITGAGGRAVAIQGNVSKPADVKRLFTEAKAVYGVVDVLVNNAGVYSFGPLASITEEEYHRQFDTNVLGVFLTIQEFDKQVSAGGGSIINITTAGTSLSSPMTALYTATKSAVTATTRILAKELAPKNIRVNAIAPGGVETEGLQALGAAGSGMKDYIVSQTPLGRMGQPDDIAPIAVFLASEDAKWVTGEVVFASGGMR